MFPNHQIMIYNFGVNRTMFFSNSSLVFNSSVLLSVDLVTMTCTAVIQQMIQAELGVKMFDLCSLVVSETLTVWALGVAWAPLTVFLHLKALQSSDVFLCFLVASVCAQLLNTWASIFFKIIKDLQGKEQQGMSNSHKYIFSWILDPEILATEVTSCSWLILSQISFDFSGKVFLDTSLAQLE